MIDPISQFNAGMFVSKQFIVEKLEIREGKNSPFLLFVLKDDSAQLRGVYFSGFEKGIENKIEKGSIVEVSGKVNLNNGENSIVIEKFSLVNDEDINPQHFLDSYPSLEKEWEKLLSLIKTVKDREFNELLNLIFSNRFVLERFKIFPAAKSMHHALLGGLLVHTLEVADLCDKCAETFGDKINRDLLITGAILHDLGKIEEFSIEKGREYSDRGRFMSHLITGPLMLVKFFDKIENFSERKKDVLIHLILSHHGKYEYKSPELPKTKEAFILNLCDDMSAKIDNLEIIKKNMPESKEWSSYNQLLDRNLFFGNLE